MPRPSLLIVDDDPVMTDLLSIQLNGEGYAVTMADDAGRAIDAIRRTAPQLVILDLNLPGGSGFSVLGTMRLEGLLGQSSVLILTGEEDQQSLDRARRLGARACLFKPFRISMLLAELDRLLDTYPAERQAVPAPDRTPAMGGGLNPVVAELMHAYGTHTVKRLLASLAGQLVRLPESTDLAHHDLAQEAHAIRGAAATLGFTSVSTACSALERACREGSRVELPLRAAAAACAHARQEIAQHLA